MEQRIQARTNNYLLDSLVRRRPYGYGFIEERHFNPDHLFIAMDKTGMVYEINPAVAKVGPAIYRGEIRGKCDEVPMMYVNENGVKFLYRSQYRAAGTPNSTQTFTLKDKHLEENMVREYCSWAGGEYLAPRPHKQVGSHIVYDDGGIRQTKERNA